VPFSAWFYNLYLRSFRTIDNIQKANYMPLIDVAGPQVSLGTCDQRSLEWPFDEYTCAASGSLIPQCLADMLDMAIKGGRGSCIQTSGRSTFYVGALGTWRRLRELSGCCPRIVTNVFSHVPCSQALWVTKTTFQGDSAVNGSLAAISVVTFATALLSGAHLRGHAPDL
jgi:hypothetical protein